MCSLRISEVNLSFLLFIYLSIYLYVYPSQNLKVSYRNLEIIYNYIYYHSPSEVQTVLNWPTLLFGYWSVSWYFLSSGMPWTVKTVIRSTEPINFTYRKPKKHTYTKNKGKRKERKKPRPSFPFHSSHRIIPLKSIIFISTLTYQ